MFVLNFCHRNESLDPGEQLKLDYDRRVKGNEKLSNDLGLLHRDIQSLSAKTPLDISLIRSSLDSIVQEFYQLPSIGKDKGSTPFAQKIVDSQTLSQLIGFLDEIYRAVYYALKVQCFFGVCRFCAFTVFRMHLKIACQTLLILQIFKVLPLISMN